MPHTTIVQVRQLIDCFYFIIFFRMIEPSRTDGNITFRCYPLITVGMPILQFSIFGISRIYLACPKERPVGSSGKSTLISYPTAPRSAIREDHRLRLQFINHLVSTRIIIVRFTVDGTYIFCSSVPTVASIGSIEPDFKDVSIISEQFIQLLIEIIHILRRTIICLMPVPWRKINGKLDTVLLAGIRKFAYNITFTVFVRSIPDAIFCQLCRPQAEAVMMFGCQDHSFHTGVDKGLHPLLTVQTSRIKRFRIGVAIAPFPVIESIETEMHKGISFHLLPIYLLFLRNR